jgi:succinoglycan biosynthesis transport protein ExoP
MGITKVLAAVWRQRLLVLVLLVVQIAFLAYALSTAPREYTATATVSAAPKAELLASTGNLKDVQATLAQLASSRSVLGDAQRWIGNARTIEQLRDGVTGELVTGTVLIRVTVVDKDPLVAAQVANAVAVSLPQHDPSDGLLDFATTDRAVVPKQFSSPDIPVVVFAGALLGLALAVGAALLRDSLARKVTSVEQIEEATASRVFGEIGRPRDSATLPTLYPGTPVASAFRELRISLEFAGRAEPVDLLVVAGAERSETDVWLGANLAVALAQVDRRVLLIDGDLSERPRHPMLQQPGETGLFDVLRGGSLIDALIPGSVEGLTVLPAGECASERSDGLVETRFHGLVGELRKVFDIVIILAPPPTLSDDLRVMAAGGHVLLVVPSGKVTSQALSSLTAQLTSVGARLVGSVLIGSRSLRVRG